MAEDQKEDEVALGDKRVELSTFDRYKGRKGITDRIGIISGSLIRRWTFFHEVPGKKTTFIAPTDPETLAFCKKQLGEPQQKFGLVLFHYTTDENGALLVEDKLKGKHKIWVITENRYAELTNMAASWPLMNKGFGEAQNDLKIKCSEEQYQRLTITPEPNAFWKSKKNWYDHLMLKDDAAKASLRKAMGRQLENKAIMELLGAAIPSQTGGTDNANDVDLTDVLGE